MHLAFPLYCPLTANPFSKVFLRQQSFSFEQLCDDIYALVDPQRAAVQRQVVILGVSPLHIGVEAVIGGSAFILIPQALLRGPLPLAIHFDDAFRTELHIHVDKDFQTVRLVLQNVVGTAANNDARVFFRKSGNDLILLPP